LVHNCNKHTPAEIMMVHENRIKSSACILICWCFIRIFSKPSTVHSGKQSGSSNHTAGIPRTLLSHGCRLAGGKLHDWLLYMCSLNLTDGWIFCCFVCCV
jgi:hypothetical protein